MARLYAILSIALLIVPALVKSECAEEGNQCHPTFSPCCEKFTCVLPLPSALASVGTNLYNGKCVPKPEPQRSAKCLGKSMGCTGFPPYCCEGLSCKVKWDTSNWRKFLRPTARCE
ncbi:uncharacterized protein LOC122849406 [Aphidius gifuensis]|uniref:uncharacterized protein LOC122849406 n=1 Tax=Aphidius gifuensis TaxID=684658 RepID=UPI001CDB48C5|nr:uncharacterized protein LOC122849406 [Aphidius gifuensis]